jgi:hypothetical protein
MEDDYVYGRDDINMVTDIIEHRAEITGVQEIRRSE